MSSEALAESSLQWSPQPDAARLVAELLEERCQGLAAARNLREKCAMKPAPG